MNQPTDFTNREITTFMEENRQDHAEIKKLLTGISVEVEGIQKWRERINGGLYVVAFLGFSGFIAIILWWIKLFS